MALLAPKRLQPPSEKAKTAVKKMLELS